MSNQSLIQMAMSLPLHERVDLAEALWLSICEDLPSGDERDAIDEAIKRDAELSSGTVVGRTHEEVMQAARRALGCG